ncbi:hypothetical protein [Pseudoxanthobacter sp.]|uniref:hypothetical protein n=1 Tax=Pseudoxanthobacter sp. TaxID=1925742 RepID=UPI002FDF1E46
MASRDPAGLVAHVIRALEGSIDVLFGRQKALAGFEFSVEAFWLSFGAIVLLVPALVISTVAEAHLAVGLGLMEADSFPWTLLFATRAGELVIDWIGYPLILMALARPLGIAPRFVPYVIVRNWSSVVAAAIYVLPELLFTFGLVDGEAWFLANLVVLVIVLFYHYRVARLALAAPVGLCIGLVALETVFSILVSVGFDRLIGL